MRTIKWLIGLSFSFVALALLTLEIYYQVLVYQVEFKLPQAVYEHDRYTRDLIWIALGEQGDVQLDQLSATELLYQVVRYSYATRPYADRDRVRKANRDNGLFGKGFLLIGNVARLHFLSEMNPSQRGHAYQLAYMIWLSNHAEAGQLLNIIADSSYMGYGQQGIRQASEFYFNKDESALTPGEMVSLIALEKGPTYFDPFCHPDRLQKRVHELVERLKSNWPERYGGMQLDSAKFVAGERAECS